MSEVDIAAGEPAPESSDLAQDAIPEDSSPPAEPAAEPKPKGVQKRLDELTHLRREAERDRDYWRDLALANAKREQPKEPTPAPVQTDKEPDISEFADYSDYVKAQARYEARQEFRATMEAEKQRAEQARRDQEIAARRQAFEARAAAFTQEAPDWYRVVSSMPLLSDATLEAAQESEMGPALLYHLGKNPQLAQEFFNLSPRQAALRLGRLELELTQPKPRTISGAPEPIEPIGGIDSKGYDPNKGTAEEFRQWRLQQLRKT